MPDFSNIAIELKDVVKCYGSKPALDGISLQVSAGEIFAFLGPNGAGKTTTIKLIAGLLHADQGTVKVCGYTMGEDGLAARMRLAYMPDRPFLYEKLTGSEFLNFVGEMYQVPQDIARQRITEMVERLDMADFLNHLCESYSHGMKQKIVLTSALLHDPDVLVVDEPMVGLDPRTVRVVKDLFTERARQGRTVFMSTHTLAVAEAVADHIGIINKGRVIKVGTFAELQAEAKVRHSLEEIFLRLTEEETSDNIEGIP